MINVTCDVCWNELVDKGGLLFGPQSNDGKVTKQHACTDCWELVQNFITRTRTNLKGPFR